MEYFSKSELTKSYDNGKLYVGGYSVDLDEPNIQTYKMILTALWISLI